MRCSLANHPNCSQKNTVLQSEGLIDQFSTGPINRLDRHSKDYRRVPRRRRCRLVCICILHDNMCISAHVWPTIHILQRQDHLSYQHLDLRSWLSCLWCCAIFHCAHRWTRDSWRWKCRDLCWCSYRDGVLHSFGEENSLPGCCCCNLWCYQRFGSSSWRCIHRLQRNLEMVL